MITLSDFPCDHLTLRNLKAELCGYEQANYRPPVSGQKAATDLPLYLASNRLLAQGRTQEQVNEYLDKTPLEQTKAENRKAQEQK